MNCNDTEKIWYSGPNERMAKLIYDKAVRASAFGTEYKGASVKLISNKKEIQHYEPLKS